LEVGEFHRTVSPEMIAALDSTPHAAARAALAIGRSKLPAEAAAPLRAHASASNPSERAMVMYALGLLGDQGSLPGFRHALHDENSAVRYAAVDALGRVYAAGDTLLLTREAADELLDAGAHDSDPVVRGHALAQLDAFRTLPFAGWIAHRLQDCIALDPDQSVRWHAAWMLYRGYAKYADLIFLKRMAADRNELVRVETMRALGRRSELKVAAIVRTRLSDPSWRVQFEAREALRRLALVPPTQHLRVMPPDINLPALPATANLAHTTVRPVPSPSGSPEKPGPPDPATFALGAPLLPRTAADMNGPACGPHPRVLLRTTKGDVVVRLYPEWAPSTVANFLTLTRDGYFDGNRWFRIVPDFVVQTGDPTNTGDGDAGYMIPAEENPLEQRSGIIAMGLNYNAAGPERDSAGTQFYVTLSPQLHLDRAFSVFGEVQEGFDSLARMDERDRINFAVRLKDG
jgi:cyclophilin family peptidyl-prolyl cis-trans isomerase/HEAT repeat protein